MKEVMREVMQWCVANPASALIICVVVAGAIISIIQMILEARE